jgi:Tol biopolymer transport system component
LKTIDMNGKPATCEHPSPAKTPAVVFARDDTIYFRDNPTNREITVSQGEDKYFLPQLSPDRKHVAYIGLSTGISITNLENHRTISIGLGTDVAWTPDSKGIIYTYSRDDGHHITASDLYYADVATGKITNLTHTPDLQESHAAISPTGAEVAYIINGQVFLSQLRYELPSGTVR